MTTRALGERQSLLPATLILSIAAGAWAGIVIWAREMGVVPGTMGMTVTIFVIMWTLMMAAMMLPSAMPMITLYARTLSSNRWRRMSAFGAGYLFIWAVSGIPVFALAWLSGRVATNEPDLAVGVAVVIFAAAGLYQLTSLKHRCLQHCRSPLAHLLHYGNYRGRLRDLRAGAHHGAFCLACCWALMLLMVAFGVMNLLAMVLLAATVGIEKQWKHGAGFAKVAGLAALALAIVVIFVPDLAPGLQAGGMATMGTMGS